WLSGRTRLPFAGEVPGWVKALYTARSKYLFFDPGVWSFLVLAGVVAVLLRYTVLGRHCYAVGSSEATARLCGINVDRTKLTIYGLAGLFTGWGGVLRFAPTPRGAPSAGARPRLGGVA